MASSVRVGPPSLVYQQVRSSALRFVCSKLQHGRADGTLCVLMVDEESCAAVDAPPGVELHSRMVGFGGGPTGRLYDAVVVSLVGLGGPSRSAALREAMLAAGDASPCVIVTCSEGRGAWVLREKWSPSPSPGPATGGSDSPATELSIAQMIEAAAGAASPPRAILREPFHAVLDLGDGLDAAGAAEGRGRPSSREPAALPQRATLSSVVSALLGADAAATAARWPAELGASLAELRVRTLHNVATAHPRALAGGAAAARTVLHLPLTASVLGPWDRHWLLLLEQRLAAPPPTPPPQMWHPASAALPPLIAGGMQFLASMADHLGLAAKLSATFGPPGAGAAGGAPGTPGGRLGSPSTDSEAAGVELPLRTHEAAAATAGDAAPPPPPPLPCAPWPVPLALHLSVQGGAERFADGSAVLAMVEAPSSGREARFVRRLLAEGAAPPRLYGAGVPPPHAFDPWFPHGAAGAFLNLGLATWHDDRASWLARPPGHTRRPPPRSPDLDALCAALEDADSSWGGGLGERGELRPGGGPVSLADLVDCCVDMWGAPADGSDQSDDALREEG